MKAPLVVVMIIAMALSSHGTTGQILHYGFKAGYNLSSISHIPNTRSSFSSGIATGVYIDFAPTRRVHFSPEILYSVTGVKSTYFDPASGAPLGSRSIALKYVLLPIIFKVYLTDALHVDVGAQVGRLVSSSYAGTFNGSPAAGGYYRNTTPIDYAVVIGVGYDFDKRYHAGMRYNYGVNSIYKLSLDPQGDEPVNANRVGNFYIGYTF